MDRAEGALRVAEQALREARSALEQLKRMPQTAVSFVINEAGDLMAAFADGSTKVIGRVRAESRIELVRGEKGDPGRDGQPGIPGRDGKDGLDGKPGPAGRDGFAFADLKSVEAEEGGRFVVFRFARGDESKEFRVKTANMIHKGQWTERQYCQGDVVFWQGSMFTALADTKSKPDTVNCDWQLSVRRGRDGKNGKDGDRGPAGPKGDKGDIGPRGLPSG